MLLTAFVMLLRIVRESVDSVGLAPTRNILVCNKRCKAMVTFRTFEAGGQLFLVFINSVGKSPGNHRQECKNAATAAVVACSANNGEERYS